MERRGVAAWTAYELRIAARGLIARPAFTATTVLTLGLAIAANATMFAIVDRLLLRPPSRVQQANAVRRVFVAKNTWLFGARASSITSFPLCRDLIRYATSIERVACYATTTLPLGRGANAELVRVALVTRQFFPLLGIRAAAGRLLANAGAEERGSEAVAVLSFDFWQRGFGGRRSALGSQVLIGDVSYTIIGVAPTGFTGVDVGPTDIWLPLATAAATMAGPDWEFNRASGFVRVIGRLREGTSSAQSAAQLTTVMRAAESVLPGGDPLATVTLGALNPLLDPGRIRERQVTLSLLGLSVAVLLIACANVAQLLLVRAWQRRGPTAVRMALGAPRHRLTAQVLAEACLLAGAGALIGILLAVVLGASIRSRLLPDVAWPAPPVDGRVLVATMAAALASALATALLPAIEVTRSDVAKLLREGAADWTRRAARLGTALVASQTTLTTALLVVAALFVGNLREFKSMDLGIDVARLLVVEIDAASAGYSAEETEELFRNVRRLVSGVPGIAHASVVSSAPLRFSYGTYVTIPGVDSIPHLPTGGPYINAVDAEFFRTAGVRVIRGRGFNSSDSVAGTKPVVINTTMARLIWNAADPVGRCMQVGRDPVCREVVGVIGDIKRDNLSEAETMQLYVPLHQAPAFVATRTVLVRTTREPSSFVADVQRAARRARAELPYVNVQPFEALIVPQLRIWKLGATVFTSFGTAALVLAAIGLFSILAFRVTARARDLAIRAALGADSRWIARDVLGAALIATGPGLLGGLLLGRGAYLVLGALTVEQAWPFPIVGGTVAALILLTTALASAIPGWRAGHASPMDSLRV
jgi:predicted permease